MTTAHSEWRLGKMNTGRPRAGNIKWIERLRTLGCYARRCNGSKNTYEVRFAQAILVGSQRLAKDLRVIRWMLTNYTESYVEKC